MDAREYQSLAMRTKNTKAGHDLTHSLCTSETCPGFPDTGFLVNACFGLSGEVGEFIDMMKKWIFHGRVLDEDHAKKELGDIMWYIAAVCDAFHWDLDEILTLNVEKLKARYPDGFDTAKSNNRTAGDV